MQTEQYCDQAIRPAHLAIRSSTAEGSRPQMKQDKFLSISACRLSDVLPPDTQVCPLIK